MNPADYEALELDKVLARLARHTAFSASRELALALEPTGELAAARRRQAATSEARQLRAHCLRYEIANLASQRWRSASLPLHFGKGATQSRSSTHLARCCRPP